MFTFYSFIKREKSSFNPIQWKGNWEKKKIQIVPCKQHIFQMEELDQKFILLIYFSMKPIF